MFKKEVGNLSPEEFFTQVMHLSPVEFNRLKASTIDLRAAMDYCIKLNDSLEMKFVDTTELFAKAMPNNTLSYSNAYVVLHQLGMWMISQFAHNTKVSFAHHVMEKARKDDGLAQHLVSMLIEDEMEEASGTVQ